VRRGALRVVSGLLCLGPDGKLAPAHTGRLGAVMAPVGAAEGARLCAINILAQAKAALGSLDAITRCIRLGGFINVAPGFTAIAPVMNGASDLIVAVLGDRGRHARSTIGVAELPLGAVVEVEAMFEVA
jgi:enamine deaminase RidA (YjgF/YER057c/UK114 family)